LDLNNQEYGTNGFFSRNMGFNVDNGNVVTNNITPFDDVLTNTMNSHVPADWEIDHIAVSQRIADWIHQRVTGTLPTTACQNFCQSVPTIQGNTVICSNSSETVRTFRLLNVPWWEGIAADWQVSSNLQIERGQGSGEILVKYIGAGSGWVKVTLNTTNINCTPYVIQRSVWLGAPPKPTRIEYNLSRGFPTTICVRSENAEGYFEAIYDANIASSVEWFISRGSIISQNGAGVYVRFNGAGTYTIGVRACGCGCSAYFTRTFTLTVSSSCGGGFSLLASPNPASEELTVEVADSTNTANNTAGRSVNICTDLPENYQITLYNAQGMAIQKLSDSQRKLKLNVSTVEEGIYYLEVIYREAVIRKRVVIRR
jgi:hypothetical protein